MLSDSKPLAARPDATNSTITVKESVSVPGLNKDDDNKDVKSRKFSSTDEFIAGWTAAFVNTSLLFPLNKLIFRQMAGGYRALYAADQMKAEGLSYLYRGLLPPLTQKMFSVSLMFGSFGHYRKWADRKFADAPPIARLSIAACLTGTTEAILTPLERVQMLLQDRKYHKDYKNTIDALIKLRKFGAKEYYRGLTCVLVRNGPSNILFFGLRDDLKQLLSDWSSRGKVQVSQKDSSTVSNKSSGTSQSQAIQRSFPTKFLSEQVFVRQRWVEFLSGAILGMCISTLFYPLSVVRTRMQTRAPGTEFLSIVKAFTTVYNERDRKFSRLFHGCLVNVIRQFLSWGVINASYELVLSSLQSK